MKIAIVPSLQHVGSPNNELDSIFMLFELEMYAGLIGCHLRTLCIENVELSGVHPNIVGSDNVRRSQHQRVNTKTNPAAY